MNENMAQAIGARDLSISRIAQVKELFPMAIWLRKPKGLFVKRCPLCASSITVFRDDMDQEAYFLTQCHSCDYRYGVIKPIWDGYV